MSDYLTRKQKLNFINTICSCHDLTCPCDQAPFHSLKLLTTQLSAELTTTQKEEIQKCLGITTAGDGVGADDPGFDTGDLEKLFEEDGDEG